MSDLPRSDFNGPDYQRELDFTRLTGQIHRVFNTMIDRKWRTLREIEAITGDPQSSISAQLRHLRKVKFGSHTVLKRRRGDRRMGLFEYCLHRNGCPCDTCQEKSL
jgi:hypothetical protein